MINKLLAPFPYSGGKSTVADIVWKLLDNPRHYIEPFFGSGAVLLNRPNYNPITDVETINDKDGYLVNVWRALKYNPAEVAYYCDYPVTHLDMYARRKYLIEHGTELFNNLANDDMFYDAKMAGYWIYGTSSAIGGRYVDETHINKFSKKNDDDIDDRVSIKDIPSISKSGEGINKLSMRENIGGRPHIAKQPTGINKLSMRENIGGRPHIDKQPAGINKLSMRDSLGSRPNIAFGGEGINKLSLRDPNNTNLMEWFNRLSERLRYVRIVNGDWTRVCGGNWHGNIGIVGFFFDPPYSVADRDGSIYMVDSQTVAKDVAQWCFEHGDKPLYRIVLAGYYEEHKWLLEHGWKAYRYKVQGGFSNQRKSGVNNNRFRETLFYNSNCIPLDDNDILPIFNLDNGGSNE